MALLPPPICYNHTLVEYIWRCGGTPHSCTRILDHPLETALELRSVPRCEVEGDSGDITLRPVRLYKDPFRGNNGYLVLCEVWLPGGAHSSNARTESMHTFERMAAVAPRFELRQPVRLQPAAAARESASARSLGFEQAVANCLYAEVGLVAARRPSGGNEAEFCVQGDGVRAADNLEVMRYIVRRTGESFDLDISTGGTTKTCTVVMSTAASRVVEQNKGVQCLRQMLERLQRQHAQFGSLCGASPSKTVAVRIPRDAESRGGGALEDRRPPADMDPHLITSRLLQMAHQP